MSEIPESAIEAAKRAQLEAMDMDPGLEKSRHHMLVAAALEAALPALHESWEAEAIERVEGWFIEIPEESDKYDSVRDEHYNAGIKNAIRAIRGAIRGEPGDE